jgi:ligand-binding sensor domain-containing protein
MTLRNSFKRYTLITRGNIWVGTAGAGVYHFNEKDIKKPGTISVFEHYFTKSNSPLGDDYVMSLAGDRDGNVWLECGVVG